MKIKPRSKTIQFLMNKTVDQPFIRKIQLSQKTTSNSSKNLIQQHSTQNIKQFQYERTFIRRKTSYFPNQVFCFSQERYTRKMSPSPRKMPYYSRNVTTSKTLASFNPRKPTNVHKKTQMNSSKYLSLLNIRSRYMGLKPKISNQQMLKFISIMNSIHLRNSFKSFAINANKKKRFVGKWVEKDKELFLSQIKSAYDISEQLIVLGQGIITFPRFSLTQSSNTNHKEFSTQNVFDIIIITDTSVSNHNKYIKNFKLNGTNNLKNRIKLIPKKHQFVDSSLQTKTIYKAPLSSETALSSIRSIQYKYRRYRYKKQKDKVIIYRKHKVIKRTGNKIDDIHIKLFAVRIMLYKRKQIIKRTFYLLNSLNNTNKQSQLSSKNTTENEPTFLSHACHHSVFSSLDFDKEFNNKYSDNSNIIKEIPQIPRVLTLNNSKLMKN